MPTVTPTALTAVAGRILQAAGAPDDIAANVGKWLVNSDLSGHPSHGVIRIPDYLAFVASGVILPAERPRVIAETDTTVLVDGRQAFGHVSADALIRAVSEKALDHDVAIGGGIRFTHIGRLGEWVDVGAQLGVLCLVSVSEGRGDLGVPFGGKEARLDSNPMAFGAPAAEGDGFTLDIATTAVAEGKVRAYRDRGEPIPDSWVLDRDGHPTTDPSALYDGGVLQPFGGHKGSGLGIMISILCGNLVAAAQPELELDHGVFALAINPSAFGDSDLVLRAIRQNLARVRTTPPAPGFSEVLVPGDYERKAREAALGTDIEVPGSTWERIIEAAETVGVEPDSLRATARGG